MLMRLLASPDAWLLVGMLAIFGWAAWQIASGSKPPEK